jgi:orotidine-5'-phosphate decarboxylase
MTDTISNPESAAERIIVPLDVPGEREAIALIRALPEVTFWKIGLELFVSCGPSLIKTLKAENKRVFLDLKFHDIPNTMAGACRAAGRYGVDLLTVHASAGAAALSAAQRAVVEGAEAAGCAPPKVVAVTLLTSIDGRSLNTELQVSLSTEDYVLEMAKLAQTNGLGGVVCSAWEATQLRVACGDSFLLVCPGVRPSWEQSGDQQRVMTPNQALEAGADYLVIGRPITQATDPADAWTRICEEIAS